MITAIFIMGVVAWSILGVILFTGEIELCKNKKQAVFLTLISGPLMWIGVSLALSYRAAMEALDDSKKP